MIDSVLKTNPWLYEIKDTVIRSTYKKNLLLSKF